MTGRPGGDAPTLGEDVLAFGRSLRAVSREIVKAPSRWGAHQWTVLGAVVLATIVAYAEKWPLQALVERGDGTAAHALAELADVLGSGLATVSYGVAAFAVGRWAKRRALVDAAMVLGAGGAWCFALTEVGQLVLAECRPLQGGAMHLVALGGHGVSGHACAAALLVSTARHCVERGTRRSLRRIANVGLLAWAVVVCWSRVFLGQHFVWNVMLGFAIGAFISSVAHRALAPAR